MILCTGLCLCCVFEFPLNSALTLFMGDARSIWNVKKPAPSNIHKGSVLRQRANCGVTAEQKVVFVVSLSIGNYSSMMLQLTIFQYGSSVIAVLLAVMVKVASLMSFNLFQ